jgi:hypothetical protein
MTLFIATFVLFMLSIACMALGLLAGGRPLKGGCKMVGRSQGHCCCGTPNTSQIKQEAVDEGFTQSS